MRRVLEPVRLFFLENIPFNIFPENIYIYNKIIPDIVSSLFTGIRKSIIMLRKC